MKRHAILPAIVIMIFSLVISGIAMIVLDQPFQFVTSWEQTGPYSSGIYDSSVLQFFTEGWFFMSLIVLISHSAWLFLRAQEDGRESP
jgi:hypothetical protein